MVFILYGGIYIFFVYIFRKFGIRVKFVNFDYLEEFEKVIIDKIKVVFVEIFGNFNINIFDFEVIVEIVYRYGILFIVDNIFVILYLFCFIEYGVDIVVYLMIKFLGGYGILIVGIVVDFGKFEWNEKFLDLI